MNINGKTKIWVNEYEGSNGTFKKFSAGISKKTDDGYINGYLPIRFRKGIEVENGTEIDIKDGFLSLESYTNKEGKEIKNVVGVVLEFDTITKFDDSFDELPF